MRISDWSSDVCSSDLRQRRRAPFGRAAAHIESLARAAAATFRRSAFREDAVGNGAHALCRPTGRAHPGHDCHLSPKGPDRTEIRRGDHDPQLQGSGERFWPGPLPFQPLFLLVVGRSEEHTSELQSLMRISYAVFYLK